MSVRVDPETGVPLLGGGATPPPAEDLAEHPISPKENGELKEAVVEQQKAEQEAANLGLNVVLVLAEALTAYQNLQKAIERREHASERAIKSTGIQRERVKGFDLARGMIKFTRRPKDAREG